MRLYGFFCPFQIFFCLFLEFLANALLPDRFLFSTWEIFFPFVDDMCQPCRVGHIWFLLLVDIRKRFSFFIATWQLQLKGNGQIGNFIEGGFTAEPVVPTSAALSGRQNGQYGMLLELQRICTIQLISDM